MKDIVLEKRSEKLNDTMTRLQSLAAILQIIHDVSCGVCGDDDVTNALYGAIALLDATIQDLDAVISAPDMEG